MIGKLTENSQLKGNLSVGGSGVEYEAGTGIDITDNVISNTITSYNDLSDKPLLSAVATSGDFNDLINKPSSQVLTTESDTFTFEHTNYTIDIAKYGNIVEIEINTDDFKGAYIILSQMYTIYQLEDKYKPPFEWVFPLLSFGEFMGTCWITPEGEIQVKYRNTSYSLVRMHLIYIANN